MKRIIKSVIVIILVMIVSVSVHAQFPSSSPGGPGSGVPGTPGVPADTGGVPFDGGLSIILIAVGAGLARRRKATPPQRRELIQAISR